MASACEQSLSSHPPLFRTSARGGIGFLSSPARYVPVATGSKGTATRLWTAVLSASGGTRANSYRPIREFNHI
jgi:hypothetical protein